MATTSLTPQALRLLALSYRATDEIRNSQIKKAAQKEHGVGNDTDVHRPRSSGNTQMQHPAYLQHVPHGRNRGF